MNLFTPWNAVLEDSARINSIASALSGVGFALLIGMVVQVFASGRFRPAATITGATGLALLALGSLSEAIRAIARLGHEISAGSIVVAFISVLLPVVFGHMSVVVARSAVRLARAESVAVSGVIKRPDQVDEQKDSAMGEHVCPTPRRRWGRQRWTCPCGQVWIVQAWGQVFSDHDRRYYWRWYPQPPSIREG